MKRWIVEKLIELLMPGYHLTKTRKSRKKGGEK
jgi:hypothetical protein